MPETPPGETRERVYCYVRERLFEGRAPTIREVQHAFSFRAVETARGHLEALVQEGRLAKKSGQARGFALPELEGLAIPRLVPILGRVQAGASSTAVQDLDGYLHFEAKHLLPSRRGGVRHFARTSRGRAGEQCALSDTGDGRAHAFERFRPRRARSRILRHSRKTRAPRQTSKWPKLPFDAASHQTRRLGSQERDRRRRAH